MAATTTFTSKQAEDLPRATTREWFGLYVLSIACLLYSMDLSVLFLAIPSIVRDLDPSPTQLLWINDIYGFMVAGFLVTMGTLGDRIGRRKVLLYGAGAFGLASLLCAISTSATMLVLSRAVLGIAGATIAPSTLSLIVNMFHREDERNQAIGIWGTAFALGGLVGPVIGGVLLHWFYWGSVFLINVPIMAVMLLVAPKLLPEFKNDSGSRMDLTSVALSLAAVLPVIYALKHFAAYGFDVKALGVLVAGLAIGVVFVKRQTHLENPLVDPKLFASMRFNVALFVNLAGICFIFAIFMFQSQYFQLVLRLSPLEAGLWSAAPSLVFVLMSFNSHKFTNHFGPERTVVWGLAIFAASSALMAIATWYGSLFGILFSSAGTALGFVPVILTTTGLIMAATPPERAGSASAIAETSSEFGGALGVALLGALGTWIYRTTMSHVDAPEIARTTLSAALEQAGTSTPAWLAEAQQAFATGYIAICLVSALGLALTAFSVAQVFLAKASVR
jgi:MFS transporter, DHA2 family, multidrug resistance protein